MSTAPHEEEQIASEATPTTATTTTEIVDPAPSILGTQQYWDDLYVKEVENFEQFGDKGEVWFGEDVQDRVLMHIEQEFEGILDPTSTKVLDLGCGNGMFLIQLSQEQSYEQLYGVDYSGPSIELAKKIASSENIEINYEAVDFLDDGSFEACELLQQGGFQLIHDKGTFDAICLYADKEKRDVYKQRVLQLLARDVQAYFIITSCNWTQDELKIHFGGLFDLHSTVSYPSFQFGGSKGSTVATCVFKHKGTDY